MCVCAHVGMCVDIHVGIHVGTHVGIGAAMQCISSPLPLDKSFS